MRYINSCFFAPRARHPWMALLLATALVLLFSKGAAAWSVPIPVVERSPDAGELWNESPVDLAPYGIIEEEFFFEGTTSVGPYKSRMIVRRPMDSRRFNGTVIVEWMNASSGSDLDVTFLSMLPLMAEKGYAFVAVTAQQVTVNFLRGRNPDRYGTLEMEDILQGGVFGGQPAAFEVFSQAGKALLNNGAVVDPMGGLQVERLIAIGQSQSSSRLTNFVNLIHGIELEPVYDAVIPLAGGPAPQRFPIPVFKINSENEAPGYFGSRGLADDNYRYWEIPGTAHQPNAGTQYAIDLLIAARGFFPICPFPYDGGVGGPTPIDPVLRAAVSHLDTWIKGGAAPPEAPYIDMLPSPTNPNQGVIQRDQYGNALGGIRMPHQEVPVGRSSPSYGCQVELPGIGSITLNTWPQWDAFDGGNDPAVDPTDIWNDAEPASANAVYGNHGRYVSRFVQATNAVERAGFILPFDARQLRRDIAASDLAK